MVEVFAGTSTLSHEAWGLDSSLAVYSQKAGFLKNVVWNAALYLPSESSETESLVFNNEPVVDREQTPVAFMSKNCSCSHSWSRFNLLYGTGGHGIYANMVPRLSGKLPWRLHRPCA